MPSKSNLGPKLQRVMQPTTENGLALVTFRSKGPGDRPVDSRTAYGHRDTEYKAAQSSEGKKDSPRIYKNTASDDARQLNKSGQGGPTISHNNASGKSKQVNGDVGDEVALKCFE